MRILVISQYFPPDITAAAFRIGDTVEYLVRKGHEVCVLTAQPHKARGNSKVPGIENLQNVPIYRSRIFPIGQGGLRKYLLHYFSFIVGSVCTGILLYLKRWRPQIIWATSPPLFVGISSFLLSKVFRCPFVFDIRDIWPESAVSAGQISQSGKVFQIGKVLEKKLYATANHLTCVSNVMAKYLRGMTSTQVTVVYNGVRSPGQLKQNRLYQEKTIMYAGNFGRVQGLEILIQGFVELKDTKYLKDWKAVLIGTGAHEHKLRNLITSLHLEKEVIISTPMSREDVLQVLGGATVLFIHLKADKVFELTVPSKVFDYMLTSRPILAGILGEGKQILGKTGGNICFEPGNIESFKNALIEVTSGLASFEEKAYKNSEFVLTNYSRENSTTVLATVFEEVLKENSNTK